MMHREPPRSLSWKIASTVDDDFATKDQIKNRLLTLRDLTLRSLRTCMEMIRLKDFSLIPALEVDLYE